MLQTGLGAPARVLQHRPGDLHPGKDLELARFLRDTLRRIDPNDAFWREHLRAFRSVELLERVGTPEAVSLLKVMAGGDSLASPTLSAQAALRRLTKP